MNTIEIEGKILDLPAIEADCWQRLTTAVLSYKDPFHNPVVANLNEHGVNMRTVVLRKADAAEKELFFHSDIRSGKWEELNASNNISWLFYSTAGKIQIRLAGTASLHYNDEMADEAWAKSSMSSRKVYSGEAGPSSFSAMPTSGLPPQFDDADPTPEESEAGRKNFGIVAVRINWMEWVWLNSKGHRRAAFHYKDKRDFKASWLVP